MLKPKLNYHTISIPFSYCQAAASDSVVSRQWLESTLRSVDHVDSNKHVSVTEFNVDNLGANSFRLTAKAEVGNAGALR